jgi:hypothetical protein
MASHRRMAAVGMREARRAGDRRISPRHVAAVVARAGDPVLDEGARRVRQRRRRRSGAHRDPRARSRAFPRCRATRLPVTRKDERMTRTGAAPTLIALLCSLALACGGGSSGSSAPTPTPAPTGAPTPTPAEEPTPTPSPSGPTAIVPMSLGAFGRAAGVNAREWILILTQTPRGGQEGRVVLPPDAGPGAGPLPVLGCPLGAPDPECAVDGFPVSIGETDWIYGVVEFFTKRGLLVQMPLVFGPDGEYAELVAFATGDYVLDIGLGPGPLFFGREPVTVDTWRPVVWRTPGLDREPLPNDGFANGPRPAHADERGRIVGNGLDPFLPVLWRPADDGWALETLPLLAGGARGAARGIDDELIVGWSDEGGIAQHAVAWTEGDDGYAIAKLPLPDGTAACPDAIAVSDGRIVGECADADARRLAVVWERRDDAWTVRHLLAPLDGGDETRAVGISGTLVAGQSFRDFSRSPVAWRLPPRETPARAPSPGPGGDVGS